MEARAVQSRLCLKAHRIECFIAIYVSSFNGEGELGYSSINVVGIRIPFCGICITVIKREADDVVMLGTAPEVSAPLGTAARRDEREKVA